MRAQIEQVPDGTWEADGWLDDDGRNRGEPLYVHAKVTIEGSDITVDLSKSCDNVPTGFNVPFGGSTLPGIYTVIRSVFLDEATFTDFIPQNDGIFRPIKVIAREGSIFNPDVPALGAVARVPDPARVGRRDPGAGRGRARPRGRRVQRHRRRRLHRLHPREVRVLGARRDQRGLLRRPLRQGRHRRHRRADGQLAQHADRGDRLAVPAAHRALRAARPAAGAGPVARRHRDHPRQPVRRGRRVHVGDRPRLRPAAAACSAATPGTRCGSTSSTRTGPRSRWSPSRPTTRWRAGSALVWEQACGGGYGDPFERDPEAVLRDVREELVSVRGRARALRRGHRPRRRQRRPRADRASCAPQRGGTR